jgi:hypothetical protein
MSIICEFCSVSVKTKYNLKSHLINNKNCLKKRGVKLESNFICNGCNFIFTNNTNLSTHKEICKKYIILKIKEELDGQIKDDKDKYEKENRIKFDIELHNQKNEYENKIEELTNKLKNVEKENRIKFDIELHNQKNEYENKIEELTNKLKNVELEKRDLEKEITQHELKIIDMKYNYEKIFKDIQSQNDKLLENLQKLASQAIDRPTNSTTTTNNITIKNHFSDKHFLESIKAEDVKMKCQNYLTEQVFLEGQRGIAQLCTEHVIKTKDKKALMLCTDVSRKKFKYIDEQGNIKEDYDARTFTNKVSKPIKDASRLVYDSILFDVKSEKENLDEDDYSRKAYLNSKELKTIDCFVQISHFDDPDNNQEFKNELAILNKNLM